MKDQQAALEKLAHLVDRLEELHNDLYRLELAVEVQLRRN
jgi:hypothetical protein